MSRVVATIAALLVVLPSIAQSGDEAIYESLESVAIGRVFLTPAERRWLDARRSSEPSTAFFPPVRPGSAPPVAAPTRAKPPAGYIVSSSGQAKVWRNGEFVNSNGKAAIDTAFPGEVRVKRHGIDDDPAPQEERVEAHSSGTDVVRGVTATDGDSADAD